METFCDPIVEKLILEKIMFAYGTEIPPDVLTNLTIEQFVDFETRAVRTFFRTYIMGREVRKEVVRSVIVYHSWWQHFKETCFPVFLKQYFPVKSHREPIMIKHYHLCPHTGTFEHSVEHFRFLQGDEEPEGWMKPFIRIAEENQFGREGK